jgi:hypothetical protein
MKPVRAKSAKLAKRAEELRLIPTQRKKRYHHTFDGTDENARRRTPSRSTWSFIHMIQRRGGL